jgi:uncharacterized protein (DUF1330 family)
MTIQLKKYVVGIEKLLSKRYGAKVLSRNGNKKAYFKKMAALGGK